jgi:hypothetical protein
VSSVVDDPRAIGECIESWSVGPRPSGSGPAASSASGALRSVESLSDDSGAHTIAAVIEDPTGQQGFGFRSCGLMTARVGATTGRPPFFATWVFARRRHAGVWLVSCRAL